MPIAAKRSAQCLRADVQGGGGLLGRKGTGGERRVIAPSGRGGLGLHVGFSIKTMDSRYAAGLRGEIRAGKWRKNGDFRAVSRLSRHNRRRKNGG